MTVTSITNKLESLPGFTRYYEISVFFTIITFAWETYLNYRQLKRLQVETIPSEVKLFEDIWKIDIKEYLVNKRYNY
jgi:hypothetical protein